VSDSLEQDLTDDVARASFLDGEHDPVPRRRRGCLAELHSQHIEGLLAIANRPRNVSGHVGVAVEHHQIIEITQRVRAQEQPLRPQRVVECPDHALSIDVPYKRRDDAGRPVREIRPSVQSVQFGREPRGSGLDDSGGPATST
jgi:hypothetical protein